LPSLQDQVAGMAPQCHDVGLSFSIKRPRGALCRISRRIQQVHRNSHQTNVALTRPPSPSGWRGKQMKWRVRLRRSRDNTTKITIFLRSESQGLRVLQKISGCCLVCVDLRLAANKQAKEEPSASLHCTTTSDSFTGRNAHSSASG
jgi:hypothetical protein